MKVEDRILAYTGNSEWTDSIIKAAKGADLFVAEAYFRNKRLPLHQNLATFERPFPRSAQSESL